MAKKKDKQDKQDKPDIKAKRKELIANRKKG